MTEERWGRSATIAETIACFINFMGLIVTPAAYTEWCRTSDVATRTAGLESVLRDFIGLETELKGSAMPAALFEDARWLLAHVDLGDGSDDVPPAIVDVCRTCLSSFGIAVPPDGFRVRDPRSRA